ncbi:MAG TPA: hypothetical protein ENJ97_01560 [Planctomycetes bacterium]|nr:hypothetical protein [Planctomycetota bacterium]
MKRILSFASPALLALVFLLSACTVVPRHKKGIRVNSEPEGLTLVVPYDNQLLEVVTPCDLPEDVSPDAEIQVKRQGVLLKTVRLEDLPLTAEKTYLIRLNR